MSDYKVIIVEDESIIAMDIENAVRKLQLDVIDLVTNYDDAIKSIEYEMPDIALIDINLQNSKDGIELANEILKIKKIPIIYITGNIDNKTIQRAILTEPKGYITKPFNERKLKELLFCIIKKLNQ